MKKVGPYFNATDLAGDTENDERIIDMTMDQPMLSMPVPEMIQKAYQELRNAKADTASAAFIGVLEQIPGFNLAQGARERISGTTEVVREVDAAYRAVFQLVKATIFDDAHLSSQIGQYTSLLR